MTSSLRYAFFFAVLASSLYAAAKKPAPEPVPNDDVPSRINDGYSVAPILGYDPSYGFLLGGALFRGHVEPPRSNGSMLLYGTFKGKLGAEIKVKSWDRDRIYYNLELVTGNFYEPYSGEGDRTNPNSEVNLDAFKTSFIPTVGYRFSRTLTLGVYSQVRYRSENGLEDKPGVRMFGSELRPAFGTSFTYDGRDNQIDSRHGQYATLSVDYGPASLDTEAGASDFARIDSDLRSFTTVASWLVLAAQIRAGTSFGDPGFQYRFALGGNDTIRGLHNNRLRGASYYLGQLETRFQLAKYVGVLAFVAAGDTADQKWADFHGPVFGKGFGLRIGLPPDFVAKIRLDYGFTNDQSGIYLNFNEAF